MVAAETKNGQALGPSQVWVEPKGWGATRVAKVCERRRMAGGKQTESLDGDGLGLWVTPLAAELSLCPQRSALGGEAGKLSAGATLGPLPAGWLYNGLNFSGRKNSTLSRTRW